MRSRRALLAPLSLAWFLGCCCVGQAAARPCTQSKLRTLLAEHRTRAWVCEDAKVQFIDNAAWNSWVFDEPATFEQSKYKVIRPVEPSKAEDILWSTKEIFFQKRQGAGSTARSWVNEKVQPGMALAVETLHRWSPMRAWQRQFMEELGVPATGVDLYAARVRGGRTVGSYGWHIDTVDALIYILAGRKRVRVAGYEPGSSVTLDRTLGAGSAVYVPGGRFHHLLSMPGTGPEDKWDSEWSVVLSIGLVNPNDDLLSKRVSMIGRAVIDRHFQWPASKEDRKTLGNLIGGAELMNFSDVHAYDSLGQQALHRYARNGDTNMMKYIMRFAGACLDCRTRGGDENTAAGRNRTALGVAICCSPASSAREVVDVLLSHGAQEGAVELRRGDSAGQQPVAAAEAARERSLPELAGIRWKARTDEL